MAKSPNDPRITPFIGSVTLLTAIFTTVGWYLAYNPNSPFQSIPSKIGAHLVLCIPLFLAVYFLIKRQVDPRYLILFALFYLVLGPVGALTIFISIILFLIYLKITQPISDLLTSLLPDIMKSRSENAYERILYRLDDFQPDRVPIPFKDIMAFGSYSQKRMAIEKMLRYYRPEFAPALKMGLQDKSSAVKVQAATAMSYIDHKMFDENLRLRQIHEDDPDDLTAWTAYTSQTVSYIEADILDPDRKAKLIKEGITSLKAYLKLAPEDAASIKSLAYLLHLEGHLEEEQHLLEGLLATVFSPEAALGLMNNLYLQKKYDSLRLLAYELRENYGPLAIYPELDAAVALWTKDLAHSEDNLS